MNFAEAWATPDGKGTRLIPAEDIVYGPQGHPMIQLDLRILHEILEQAGYVNISDFHEDTAR